MGFLTGEASSPFFITGPQQRLLKKELVPKASDLLGAIPEELIAEFPTFDEPFPDINRLQQVSLTGFEQLARGEDPGVGSDLFRQGQDVLASFLEPGEEFDRFFDEVIAGPLLETLERDILPQFRREQVATGNLKSSESGAGTARILEDAFDTLARERARTGFEVSLQALGLVPEFEQIQPNLLTQMFGIGAGAQATDIQQFQARLAEFERMIAERNARLDFAFDVATAGVRAPSAAEPGFLQGLLGGSGGGAAGAGESSGMLAGTALTALFGGV